MSSISRVVNHSYLPVATHLMKNASQFHTSAKSFCGGTHLLAQPSNDTPDSLRHKEVSNTFHVTDGSALKADKFKSLIYSNSSNEITKSHYEAKQEAILWTVLGNEGYKSELKGCAIICENFTNFKILPDVLRSIALKSFTGRDDFADCLRYYDEIFNGSLYQENLRRIEEDFGKAIKMNKSDDLLFAVKRFRNAWALIINRSQEMAFGHQIPML